jgi:uncharacterized membrane protein
MTSMLKRFSQSQRLWLAVILASLVGTGLYGVGVVRNHSWDFWYLPYNLALAVIPLLLSFWLQKILKTHRWTEWLPVVVTILWILFLPNSFYVVSDFIHLNEYPRADIVQDVVMLMQFSLAALVVGFASLYAVHAELLKRMGARKAHAAAVVLLFLCSFAIYLGRDLRWNSWDVVTQPIGLFADIFNRFAHPFQHPEMFSITLSFFVMLASVYFVLWSFRGRA